MEPFSSDARLVMPGTRRREMLIVLALLSILIVGFNYPDIFSAKTLFQDDNHRYILGLENTIYDLIFKRNMLRAIVLFPLFKLLAIDPVYARLAQTLFFYIPLAFAWYWLLRLHTRLPVWLVFYASVIPCILPGQTQIPLFVDGSYTVQGLLVFVLFLHAAYSFLRRDTFSWRMFTVSSALYGASLEMMDHAVFLAPFAVGSFFWIASGREGRRMVLWLSSLVVVLALAKSYHIAFFPSVPGMRPIEPSAEIFASRLSMLAPGIFPWAYTLSGSPVQADVLWGGFIFLLICSLAKGDGHGRAIVLFALVWTLCSALVFLTVSRYYAPRFSHIPGFGMNLLLAVSIYAIVGRYKIFYRNDAVALILIGIIFYSGFSRLSVMGNMLAPCNAFHESFVRTLRKYDLPPSSQLVVFGVDLSIDGWWEYSSGYMKYAAKRKDVTGLIGPELKNYDPFDPVRRGFKKSDKMNGLSLDKPLFIFNVEEYRTFALRQMGFALRYVNGAWTVYRLDKNRGSIREVGRGKDLNNLPAFLTGRGIAVRDVAFARGRER